jgi:hypothetical protein
MKTCTIKIDGKSTKRWYFEDKLHREDGPAVECANGTKRWYINGKLHREDGPAVEWADGDRWWCIAGVIYLTLADFERINRTRKQFNRRTNKNLIPSVKVVEIDGVKYELKRVN